MKSASQGLDDRFLDGPEQGCRLLQISPRQSQCMLQLQVMKDSVQGVFSLEFIGCCRIDADIGLIAAKGGPDVPSTFAEGDGRHPIFSSQQMGSAEGVVDYLHWESSALARRAVFPEGISRRHGVLQEDGDQVIPGFRPVRPAPLEGFAVTRQGCVECRSATMIKVHGMDGII